MQDVFRYIEEHQDEAIEQLVRLTSMPSVSAQGRAIRETAQVVEGMLKELGFRAEIVPKWGGNAVVLGELAGASAKTLLFYNHYDVQPAEPLELWSSPPFEPAIRDGKIYGRGVDDNKGNLVARLAAIRALLAVRGQVPVNIKFCIEGDEEIGSPGIEPFVEKHADRLAADACIWEGGAVNWQGQLQITLGVKGILYVELAAKGASRDAHSSYATVVPNPAWRLVWALASLKDADENILVDGFYDSVRPSRQRWSGRRWRPCLRRRSTRAESLGLTGFVKGVRGLEYRLRHIFEPTCNIDGLSAGYEGGGPKTVIPCQASAKVDFRLVPDQTPDEILSQAAPPPGRPRFRRYRDAPPVGRAAGPHAHRPPLRGGGARCGPPGLRRRAARQPHDGRHRPPPPLRRHAGAADRRLRRRLSGVAHPRP